MMPSLPSRGLRMAGARFNLYMRTIVLGGHPGRPQIESEVVPIHRPASAPLQHGLTASILQVSAFLRHLMICLANVSRFQESRIRWLPALPARRLASLQHAIHAPMSLQPLKDCLTACWKATFVATRLAVAFLTLLDGTAARTQ